MTPELESYRRQFEAAGEDARDLTSGLNDSQFNWKPAPGVWSIAQCLDHLNSAYRALSRFDRAIAGGRAGGVTGTGPFRRRLIADLYIRIMEPPVRLRLKSPKLYAPRPDQRAEEVVPPFLNLQDEFVKRLSEAEGLDLARLRMSSPVTRRLKMSLAEWFAFLAAHQRRHLWQARRARGHPAFPAS